MMGLDVSCLLLKLLNGYLDFYLFKILNPSDNLLIDGLFIDKFCESVI